MSLAVNSYPAPGECTVCLVTGYREGVGFEVTLEEYGRPALIMPQDLSSKKIKKNVAAFLKNGERFPVQVLHVHEHREDESGLITVSKKDVKPQELKDCMEYHGANQRLATVARRLSHMNTGKSELEWFEQFRTLLATYLESNEKGQNMEEHPYNLLVDRTKVLGLPLDSVCLEHLTAHHSELFGVQIWTERQKVIIQSYRVDGNDYVKGALLRHLEPYQQQYSNQALYENHTLCNVAILPIAVPKFEIIARSYTAARAREILQTLVASLESSGFDFFSLTSV